MSLCSRTRVLAAACILTTALLAPNSSLAQRMPDRDIAVRASAAAPLSPVSLVSRLWSLLTSLWQADQAGSPNPGGKPGKVPDQSGPIDGSAGDGDNGSSLDPNGHSHN